MIKKDGKYRKELYCSQIQELADEESVVEVFLLDSVRYCSSSRQAKWLELKLKDSSGSISAACGVRTYEWSTKSWKANLWSYMEKFIFMSAGRNLS